MVEYVEHLLEWPWEGDTNLNMEKKFVTKPDRMTPRMRTRNDLWLNTLTICWISKNVIRVSCQEGDS